MTNAMQWRCEGCNRYITEQQAAHDRCLCHNCWQAKYTHCNRCARVIHRHESERNRGRCDAC